MKFIRLLLCISLLCITGFAQAQDVILKKDDTTILSKVVEVNTTDIKYKKWSNQDGPTYSINRTEIKSINYANGDIDYFTEDTNINTNTTTTNTTNTTISNTQTTKVVYQPKTQENKKNTSEIHPGSGAFQIGTYLYGGGDIEYVPFIQFGSYFTRHFAWYVGGGYSLYFADTQKLDKYGRWQKASMSMESIIFPLSLSIVAGNPDKFYNVKFQGGITYSYLMSVKISSDKMDLSGMDRGGFSGHVRVILFSFLSAQYDFPLNSTGIGEDSGRFHLGLCITL